MGGRENKESDSEQSLSEEEEGRKSRRGGRKNRSDREDSGEDSSGTDREEKAEKRERKKDRQKKKDKGRRGKKLCEEMSSDDTVEPKGKAKEKLRRRGREKKRKNKDGNSLGGDSESEKGRKEPSRDKGELEKCLRQLMRDFPLDVLHDLLQLLERVDEGTAADISGIPDKGLRHTLKKFFHTLGLSHTGKSKEGGREKKSSRAYGLPRGHPPTLPLIAPLVAKLLAEAAAGNSSEPKTSGNSKSAEHEVEPENDEAEGKAEGKWKDETASGGKDAEVAVVPAPRRVAGPAMPTSLQLEAAARLTAASEALRQAEAELELQSPLVGPIPPAIVAEASSATEAVRNDQVSRLLRPDITPYGALELGEACTASEMKKSYWKLSLLVHPDKCSHPQAADAFQVLNSALKALSDPDKRASIDSKLAAVAEQKAWEAEVKALREAAEWRHIRGTPEPGDEELLKPQDITVRAGLARDEWMTELPPERKAARAPQQSTFFSKTEKTGRGDTSAWTDTPQLKAEKARKLFLEAQTQPALAAPPSEHIEQLQREAREAEAEALGIGCAPEKNQGGAYRVESLVERHRKKMLEAEKEKVKKKKKKGLQGATQKPAEEWRMWDREKDLEIKPSGDWSKKDLAGGLTNRFGSSGGNFL